MTDTCDHDSLFCVIKVYPSHNTGLGDKIAEACSNAVGASGNTFADVRDKVETSIAKATGQSQTVADAAYNAESFSEFFNLREAETRRSFLWATALSAGGGALGGCLAVGGNQTIDFSFPTAIEIPDLALEAAIPFGTSMMQILIDPIVTGKTGVK